VTGTTKFVASFIAVTTQHLLTEESAILHMKSLLLFECQNADTAYNNHTAIFYSNIVKKVGIERIGQFASE
jgi:hypothetical protein